MDFLGEIGGIREILIFWCSFVFGGYLAFNNQIFNIGILYFSNSKNNEEWGRG